MTSFNTINWDSRKYPLVIVFSFFLIVGCSNRYMANQLPPSGAVIIGKPKYNAGEKWIETMQDMISGAHTEHITKVVSANGDGSYETTIEIPEYNRKMKNYYDKDGYLLAVENIVGDQEYPVRRPPFRPIEFPIWVGKKWKNETYLSWNVKGQRYYKYKSYCEVEKYEEVETQAGSFMAYRIKRLTINLSTQGRSTAVFWYSPEIKYIIKGKKSFGEFKELKRFDLVLQE